jgi:hypothetical protein
MIFRFLENISQSSTIFSSTSLCSLPFLLDFDEEDEDAALVLAFGHFRVIPNKHSLTGSITARAGPDMLMMKVIKLMKEVD